MKGALIHGGLLAVMLVYGYRTWTRDKTVKPDLGSVALWDQTEADVVSLELTTEKKTTKLERKTAGGDSYWWGTETTIEKKPKRPDEQPKAGSGSDAGSGSAAAPAEDEIKKVHEFPLGDGGDTLVKTYGQAKALRDLGTPTDEQKKDYKLADAKTKLVVTFKTGPRSFLIGGTVYGGSDRYVVDEKTGHGYVLSKDMISGLELGESSLHLLDPRGFDANTLEQVTIEAGGKTKEMVRVETGSEGQKVKTWGDAATKQSDQTVAAFLDNTNQLKPTEYAPDAKVADLTPVLKLTYKDARGAKLGTLQLFKREKPAELPAGAELDPANPPKPETEYLILSEKTRVPAIVRKDSAQRTEQDIDTVFGDHPTTIAPKANPAGDAPLPNPHAPHSLVPGSGGAAPATPAAGSAAPAAGSAAAPAKADKAPAAPAAGSATPVAPKTATPAAPAPAAGSAK